MFTAFNRDILQKELILLKQKQVDKSPTLRTNMPELFLSEGDLPERFSLVIKKFETGQFMLKQSKHVIDIKKADSLLDNFMKHDLTGTFSGILVNLFDQLKNNPEYEKYKTKTGNLMFPCPLDIDSYCSVCNLIQVMRTISSYDMKQVPDHKRNYELLDTIHRIADLIIQTFYKIEGYVVAGILYDETQQMGSIKLINVSNKFLNQFVGMVSDKLKDKGILLSDVDIMKVKVVGQPNDKFNYELIEIQDVSVNRDVENWLSQSGLIQELTDYKQNWTLNRVKGIIHKRTLNQLPDIERDFDGLIESTTELLYETIHEQLKFNS